jgi:hypothetical protein
LQLVQLPVFVIQRLYFIDKILAFLLFVCFLVSFRATIDIYSIAKAGKKDMVMFCLIIRLILSC